MTTGDNKLQRAAGCRQLLNSSDGSSGQQQQPKWSQHGVNQQQMEEREDETNLAAMAVETAHTQTSIL